MGNHHVGRAMVATATALAEHSGLEPLAILDIACEPYRGRTLNLMMRENHGALLGNC